MTTPQHFVFALVDRFTHVAFACAVDPLRIANLISGRPLYRWSYASEGGDCDLPACDRLFVLSGIDMQTSDHTRLVNVLRRLDRHGVQIGALCSGAWILGQAGLLNGQEAAIHWEYHDAFTEAFPEVHLVRNVFVADTRHVTASGGTATADLILHLIAQEHGADLATAVADQMVYNAVREATAEQRVSLQSRNGMRNAHLAAALERMQDSIADPVSVGELAAGLGISTRQLERLFGKYLNTTPKKYYMDMRLERARHLLVQTEMSVADVAAACGFESSGHFSRVYRTAFGITPMMQMSRLS